MDTNQNTTISYVQLELCGANFCNQDFTNITGNSIMRGGFEDVNSNPTKARVNLLSGILLGISLLATVIIAFLLDPLTRYFIIHRKVKVKMNEIDLISVKIRGESATRK